MPRNKSKKVYHHYPKSGVVKLPLFYLIVGILTLPFFVFLLIMGLRESIGFAIPGGALTLLSLSIIIASVNWRIDFDPVGFTYRNFFRISHHYVYDDVTAIRFDKTAIVYVGKKKFSVEESYDIGAAGAALWGIYVAVSSYIMRHADRFPNAVRWFVKDSYIIQKQKQ